MITQQQAIEILKNYQTHLNYFQVIINLRVTHLLRCDTQIIPNLLGALNAIAKNSKFKPEVAISGMSSIKELTTNPQKAIEELLVNQYFSDHFKAMCSHYASFDPKLLTHLEEFHALINPELIIANKATNEELPLKEDQPLKSDKENIESFSLTNISMMVLEGFIAVAGIAAIAMAFTLLNAATFGVAGIVVACVGVALSLTGMGLFAASTYKNCQPVNENLLNTSDSVIFQ
jgi:hypothetical protein